MKRSSQVALLLMGVGGVGAGAYAMAPPRHCVSPGGPPPAVVAPGSPAAQPCPPRGFGSGSSYYRSWSGTGSSHWSTPIFARGSSTAPASGRTSVPSIGTHGTSVAHGGFGSTGHAMSASS